MAPTGPLYDFAVNVKGACERIADAAVPARGHPGSLDGWIRDVLRAPELGRVPPLPRHQVPSRVGLQGIKAPLELLAQRFADAARLRQRQEATLAVVPKSPIKAVPALECRSPSKAVQPGDAEGRSLPSAGAAFGEGKATVPPWACASPQRARLAGQRGDASTPLGGVPAGKEGPSATPGSVRDRAKWFEQRSSDRAPTPHAPVPHAPVPHPPVTVPAKKAVAKLAEAKPGERSASHPPLGAAGAAGYPLLQQPASAAQKKKKSQLERSASDGPGVKKAASKAQREEELGRLAAKAGQSFVEAARGGAASAPVPAPAPTGKPKKTNRGSLPMSYGEISAIVPPPPPLEPAAPAAQPYVAAAAVEKGDRSQLRHALPPVPVFRELPAPGFVEPSGLRPWQKLWQIRLDAPRPEDNYEISDHEDSDQEMEMKDRSAKKVPEWVAGYLQVVSTQADIDSDTIFGSRVPKCDLEDIFKDELYRSLRKDRPRRPRGSSANWKKDGLQPSDTQSYKRRMGQAKCWTPREDLASSASQPMTRSRTATA